MKTDRRGLLRILSLSPLLPLATLERASLPPAVAEIDPATAQLVRDDRHYLIRFPHPMRAEQMQHIEFCLRSRGIYATVVAVDFEIFDIGAAPKVPREIA